MDLFDDSKNNCLRGRHQGYYKLREKILLPLLYTLGVSFPMLTTARFSCDLVFHSLIHRFLKLKEEPGADCPLF